MISIIFQIFTFYSLVFAQQDFLSANQIIPEITGIGVSATVTKQTHPQFENLFNIEDQYLLSINFDKMTFEQFEKIKALYGNKSQVKYNKNTLYTLRDFLPPSIQAVLDQTFTPLTYSFENLNNENHPQLEEDADFFSLIKNGLSTETNCWNTTIENINIIQFGSTEYRLYLPGRWEADDEITTNSKLISPTDIKTWDILVIKEISPMNSDLSSLMHTAILINQNLVFEKTDSTESDAYRISLLSDVLAKYKILFDDQLVVEYRRATAPFIKNIEFLENKDILNIIKKNYPLIDTSKIVGGCETGIGGGCDYYLQEILPMSIAIDKKTGRGLLKGSQRGLKQFKAIK